MNFPFQWISICKDEPVYAMVLEMNPSKVSPVISVQSSWNNGHGIIRGNKDKDGNLEEDHTCEYITPYYEELVNYGKKIVGPDNIRMGIWKREKHFAEFKKIYKEERIIVGWVGNGNLLFNPHFVSFARYPDGKTQLFHLESENKHLTTGEAGRYYSSLVVRKDGKVSIEKLQFKYDNNEPKIFSAGVDITDEVDYTTFGQQLVDNGTTLDIDNLCEMAKNEEFYDLRHILLFPRIPKGERRWIDGGLASFWTEDANLNKDILERAIKGETIEVNISQFGKKDVREALSAKDYEKCPKGTEPQNQGKYKLEGKYLTIKFKYGIYPHNMIGIRKDGKLLSVVIRGLSNRVGVTLLDASKIMQMLDAKDALLIDNGGDVMMGLDTEIVLPSAEGERDQLKSMILFSMKEDQRKDISHKDLKLVKYPKQYKK